MHPIKPVAQQAEDKEVKDQELYEAFTVLGSNLELCDIEFAFFAQAEVALAD